MKLYSLKCPHCGGNLEIEEGMESFFCKYCGTKIIMDRMSKSEMRVREMEHDEIMSEHQMQMVIEKAKSERADNRTTIIIVILAVIMFIVFMAFTLGHQPPA